MPLLGNTLPILRPPDRSTPAIQTGWNEDLIRNMHDVLGRLSQQLTAQTFGGLPTGSSRPASVKANVFWLDNTTAAAPIVKLFDGTDDITVMTFAYSGNTVTWNGLLNIVNDTSPQLGGNLDLNSNVITGLEIGTDVQAFDATLTSLAAVAGVSGDILYASGTDVWARLAKDTDGMFLKQVSGIPAWRASGITRYSAIVTTSGTAHGFTSIPAGTNRITMMLDGVSLSSGGHLQVELGDAGGYETSGYLNSSSSGTSSNGDTEAFRVIDIAASGNTTSGNIVGTRVDGNQWAMSGVLMDAAGSVVDISAGSKTLSAELDRIQLVNDGADTFDAGKINIITEI